MLAHPVINADVSSVRDLSGRGRARPHMRSHVHSTAFILLVSRQDDGFLMHKHSMCRQACPPLLVEPCQWAKLWESIERHIWTAFHRIHWHPLRRTLRKSMPQLGFKFRHRSL